MLETILILLFTQFLAMMSPGPDMVLILKNTVGQPKFRPAVFTILGICLGLTVHIGISIGGLAILLLQSDTFYQGVRYAGAAYLAYIGIKSLIQSKTGQNLFKGETGNFKTGSSAFREGLFTNLLNPKVTLYIISLFTQLISPDAAFWKKSVYALVLIMEALIVWLIFAQLVNFKKIKRWISRYSIWTDRLFGLLLIFIAGSVVLTR